MSWKARTNHTEKKNHSKEENSSDNFLGKRQRETSIKSFCYNEEGNSLIEQFYKFSISLPSTKSHCREVSTTSSENELLKSSEAVTRGSINRNSSIYNSGDIAAENLGNMPDEKWLKTKVLGHMIELNGKFIHLKDLERAIKPEKKTSNSYSQAESSSSNKSSEATSGAKSFSLTKTPQLQQSNTKSTAFETKHEIASISGSDPYKYISSEEKLPLGDSELNQAEGEGV